uniref:Short transient receptor potential channel 5 (inferred by orthology to a human protein) n=1 Tax=Strongyloides venezuelensis TaxID=75913 RepID=A0A0K0FLM8_STRVS
MISGQIGARVRIHPNQQKFPSKAVFRNRMSLSLDYGSDHAEEDTDDYNSPLASNFYKSLKILCPDSDEFVDKCTTVFYHGSSKRRSLKEGIKECILLGITYNQVSVVKCLMSILTSNYPEVDSNFTIKHSKFFPSYITPLFQACLVNNYRLVEMFLKLEHSLPEIHRLDCTCTDCTYEIYPSLVNAQRLDYYKAISSEAFLWYGTSDPLLSALKLIKELDKTASLDSANESTYINLSSNVRKFIKKVFTSTKTPVEVENLLSSVNGCDITYIDSVFPILSTYFEASLKEVFSDPNIVNVMQKKFVDSRTLFTRMINPYLYVTIDIFFYIVMLSMFDINFRGTPIQDEKFSRVPSGRFNINVIVIFYIYGLGLLTRIYYKCWRLGFKVAMIKWWTWFDIAISQLYLVSAYHYFAVVSEVASDGIYQINRRHWDPYGSSILCELTFAVGSIILIWRSFYILMRFKFIGLIVVCVAKCAKVIIQYSLIAGIIIVAFNAGFQIIFRPYSYNKSFKNGNIEEGEVSQMSYYENMWSTQKMLYWAIYGYFAPWEMSIVVGEAGPSNLDPPSVNHLLTQNVGECVGAIFYGILILSLLNLIVSMLVRTAEQALNESADEFKYEDSIIKFDAFYLGTAVPPPYNILYFIISFISWIVIAIKYRGNSNLFDGTYNPEMYKFRQKVAKQRYVKSGNSSSDEENEILEDYYNNMSQEKMNLVEIRNELTPKVHEMFLKLKKTYIQNRFSNNQDLNIKLLNSDDEVEKCLTRHLLYVVSSKNVIGIKIIFSLP